VGRRALALRAVLARAVPTLVLLVVATLVLLAGPAGAHALRVDSSPEANSVLKTSPAQVVVTFGEAPDPRLSHLSVLDSSGHDRAQGPTQAVAGQPRQLAVKVGHLGTGVYTVAWTTVSSVDGHLASGTFAFGVGVSAADIPAARATSATPSPSALTSGSRWLLYAGLMGLVGAAAVVLVCFGRAPRPVWPWLVVAAWVVALVGAVGIGVGEATTAHLALSHLFDSTFTHQIAVRVLPLVAGAAVAGVILVAAPRPRRAAWAVAALGLGGLGAMWGDVTDSHAAAAQSLPVLKMVEQWLHFASAGIWIGGLAALLVGLAALRGPERGRAARRYSTLALGAVVVLAASGTLRAIDEVGSWHALFATSFGRLILVKTALLAILVGLGARNRYRSVPRLARSESDGTAAQPLLRLGRVELGLAAVVLVATALLQGLAPPATAAPAAPRPEVVTGSDFATTVKVALAVSPGFTGFNQFDLTADDYDTGRPVVANPVTLTFSRPDRPGLGSSSLTLRRRSDGHYVGSGPNLSIDGTWQVVVLIQQGSSAVQVRLAVVAHPAPQRVTVSRSPGVPDLYTLSLANDDALQVYLDPGHAGLNEFHATYLGADGQEMAMRSLAVTARGPDPASDRARALTVRKLDNTGHFVADLEGAAPGRYAFVLEAVAGDGTSIRSSITLPVH
jgi:copper transport protein